MDYLYINAIVREVYKDMPCGCPFPAGYSGSLQAVLGGQDCLSNPRIPNVMSCFTMKIKGQAPVIVFSNVQKHTNCASVGRFTQCIGWAWDGEKLRDMGDVLCSGFYSEEEINATALQKGSFALPKDKRRALPALALQLTPEVKQAIVTTVMLRWLRFEAPLRVAVPRNVDYNSYVLSAIHKIYALLPTSMRARAGFCSYMPDEKNVAENIFIGFVPEEMADSRTLSLDGSSPAACAVLNCGTRNTMLDRFIQYIACAPEAEVQGFLEELYEDVEGAGDSDKMEAVTAKDYQTVGEALYLLTLQGPAAQMIPQWRKFFQTADRFSNRMRQRIRSHIRSTTKVEEFCQLFREDCGGDPLNAFENLGNYREFCEGNQPLADALWDTAVALMVEQHQSYSDICAKADKLPKNLVDDRKLDHLFQRSVEEQLNALRLKPADTEKTIDSLKTAANALMAQTNIRDMPEIPALQEEIRQFLTQLDEKRDALILAGMEASFEALKARPSNTADEIRDRLAEAREYQNSVAAKMQIQGADVLLDALKQYDAGLVRKGDELAYAELDSRFNALMALPTDTTAQIEVALDTAENLLLAIGREPQTPQIAQLQEAARRYIAEQRTIANSSNAKFRQIEAILNSGTQYFATLQALDKADKSQLEDAQIASIRQKLRLYRPNTLERYEREFEAFCSKPLTLANVAELPDYVCAIIIRDICELDKISLQCTRSLQARQTGAKIDGALHTARKISDNCSVEVSYEGAVKDTAWFKNLLQLTHSKSTVGSDKELNKVFYDLVDSGAYSGDELLPAIEMLHRCGLPFSKLFSSILQGKIRNCSEFQYQMAYEAILKGSHKKPQEILSSMVSKAKELPEKDQTAYKEFQDFVKAHTPKKRNSLVVPIVIGISAVIVAMSLTAAFFLWNRGNKEPVPEDTHAPTTAATVPPTEAPVIAYPERSQFYRENCDAIETLCGTDAVIDFAV